MADTAIKRAIANSLSHLLGRRNVVRLGRFLSNEGRLDAGNLLTSNGEQFVQSCLHRLAPPATAAIVLDIGANVGRWSRSLLLECGSSESPFVVHAFEAWGGTYRTLVDNLKQWGLADRVLAHPLAISSKDGEQTFFSVGDNQGRNSLYAHNGETEVAQSVPCRTLDCWCREQGIDGIFFVKIDTEGHDYEVLIGAKGLLTDGRIEMIQFEYNHRWIAARRFLLDAFELLLPLGYTIGKITPKGIEFYQSWHFELETFREGNYLAVQPAYRTAFPVIEWWHTP
jgi:FkbM family methyltransferase